jgi:hypothetical protein
VRECDEVPEVNSFDCDGARRPARELLPAIGTSAVTDNEYGTVAHLRVGPRRHQPLLVILDTVNSLLFGVQN